MGPQKIYSEFVLFQIYENTIFFLSGKTFHHVQQVERLILNHNNLSISPNVDDMNHLHPRVFSNFCNLNTLHLTNAFSDSTSSALSEDLHAIFVMSNLTRLRILHLEQNEISHFKDRNVFCDLPLLEDLHLGDNRLKELNFNVVCLRHLRFLDLQRNRFQSLNRVDFEALELLEYRSERRDKLIVDFNMNPFICDCALMPFIDWLHRNLTVTVRSIDRYICSYDNGDYAERLVSVRLNKCVVRSLKHNVHLGTHIFLVLLSVVLIFMFLGLISAILYVSRNRIKEFVSPGAHRVYYTTIRDEEITKEVHV